MKCLICGRDIDDTLVKELEEYELLGKKGWAHKEEVKELEPTIVPEKGAKDKRVAQIQPRDQPLEYRTFDETVEREIFRIHRATQERQEIIQQRPIRPRRRRIRYTGQELAYEVVVPNGRNGRRYVFYRNQINNIYNNEDVAWLLRQPNFVDEDNTDIIDAEIIHDRRDPIIVRNISNQNQYVRMPSGRLYRFTSEIQTIRIDDQAEIVHFESIANAYSTRFHISPVAPVPRAQPAAEDS